MQRFGGVSGGDGPDLDVIWNLAPAHQACNSAKSDRLPTPEELHRLAQHNEAIMHSPTRSGNPSSSASAPYGTAPTTGALGLYLTRSGVLASWPVEEYLNLLGTCRRDLATLRALLAELLAGCPADVVPHSQEDEDRARRLLDRPVPVITPGAAWCARRPCPPPSVGRHTAPAGAASAAIPCARRTSSPAAPRRPCGTLCPLTSNLDRLPARLDRGRFSPRHRRHAGHR